MISSLVALSSFAVLTNPSVAQDAAAAKVIAMVKHYQDRLCANGNITWTIESPKDSLKVRTDFQYLRPNKFWLLQQSVGGSRRTGSIISDGKYFVYKPVNEDRVPSKKDYVMEPIKEARSGKLLTVDEIFIVGAPGLIDRSVPLDIVMGRPDNVAHLDKLLGVVKISGTEQVNGQECTIITGTMRTIYTAAPSIRMTMAISKENELVQLKTVESIAGDNKQPITFHMTWDVSVTVNDEKQIQQKFFKLPK